MGDVGLDDLGHAQSAVTALLGALEPEDWVRPSPCEGLDVVDVVRHLHEGELAFARLLRGAPHDPVEHTTAVDAIAPTGLPAAYAAGAADLRAAFLTAGNGPFPTGLGLLDLESVCRLRTMEALVHGWDVARGARRSLDVEDAVAERAVPHSLALMKGVPPDRTPFGSPVEIDDGAPAIDRLAALLGRASG